MGIDRSTLRDLKKLAKEPPALDAFGAAAHDLTARALPYAFGAWFALDSATLLPIRFVATTHDGEAGLTRSLLEVMRAEFAFDDSFSAGAIARTPGRVTTLHRITGGKPERSARFGKQPASGEIVDELRMMLTDSSESWGMMWLYRRQGPFSKDDEAIAKTLATHLGAGLRLSMKRQVEGRSGAGPEKPGLIFLDEAWQVVRLSKSARHLVGDAPEDEDWFAVLRAAFETQEATTLLVEAASGPVSLHASGDPEELVIIVERSRPVDLTDRLVRVYGLTPRERDVVAAVSRGLSTRLIAFELDLADYTVQDHLRAIFKKVGVRSRNEIMAKLYFDHYVPVHRADALPEPAGWD